MTPKLHVHFVTFSVSRTWKDFFARMLPDLVQHLTKEWQSR